jgi:hypothetical protein
MVDGINFEKVTSNVNNYLLKQNLPVKLPPPPPPQKKIKEKKMYVVSTECDTY